MIERNRKISRFIKLHELPDKKKFAYLLPDDDQKCESTETDKINKGVIAHKNLILEHNFRSPEDILNLLNFNESITVIKWISYDQNFIQLALYSYCPFEKGHGGCSLTQDEFDELQRKAPARIQFEFIGGH